MFTLNCRGRLLVIDRPLVMGIINTTPDSFYEASRQQTEEAVAGMAQKMLEDGADMLDIGGQSTRPGSERISETEEADRVLPAIEVIMKNFPWAFLSVDTYQPGVARQSVGAGAAIVNDISAGTMNNAMLETVAGLQVPYVCMHMRGRPENMQAEAEYENVTLEVLDHLIQKNEECRQAGITDVIIDPGFGFGKTIQHNFTLLRELSVFGILNRPILAGLSRKSTVYRPLHIDPQDALNGSTVLHTLAIQNGASILRVHDVKEAKQAIRLCELLGSTGSQWQA